ncbi:hypothetical protein AGMMS50239_15150 [Bacteroidia bacterium]|nr:hypothetical protein AGMMS50239_15150 [Bacteroidia bacterium]
MGFNACKSKQSKEAGYTAGENKLTQLDVDPSLVGKRWKLVELNGKPVEKTEAFLILDKENNKVSGNLGCNTFSGSYDLKTGNRIRFSQVASTLKMCLNMETEDGLKKVLEMADNYNVSEKNLVLNRARMAPLARFELVK